MKRKIITDIRILRQKSDEIQLKDAKSIIKDLEDSLDLNKGIGLSAIQIGIPKRVAIIRIGKNKIDLINPKIIAKNKKFRYPDERCLSLPGLNISTARYAELIYENNGKLREAKSVIEAVIVQHEIDHQNGLLIIDRKWRKRK